MTLRSIVIWNIAICMLIFTPLVNAQTEKEINQFISVLSEAVKGDRVATISENMRLNPKEAAGFWTVYEKYVEEMNSVQESKIELIRNYLLSIQSKTTEESAEALTMQAFQIVENRLKIRKKYYPLFANATSPAIATRFLQLDRVLDSVINLKIAQTLPSYPTKISNFLSSETIDAQRAK